MENVLNNSIELNNNLEIEKEQNNFLETTLGKTINTGIDIGIRAILPDYIEEQIIDLKDNLMKYGLKDGIKKSIDDASLVTFERISKEGRKYGVGLVVISQRPSEVNRTVLSQSNNFIAMRLTNVDDQSVVKRLLPDSLGDYAEMLPILDVGEALVVGDASLLPSRIRVSAPVLKPRSATIDFWDEWSKETTEVDLSGAIEALRKQSK